MPRLRTPVRKNDEVVVIGGKDRGKRGRVLRLVPAKNRVIVEGVNVVKRHTRPDPRRQVKGGIVEREAPIHASNVMVIDPTTGHRTRVGHRVLDDGRKVRVSRGSGEVIDR